MTTSFAANPFDAAVDEILDRGHGWPMGAARRSDPLLGAPPAEIAIQQLLDRLEADLGLCLPPREQQRLRESAPPADQLAAAIFTAAGLNPAHHPHLFHQAQTHIHTRDQGVIVAS